MAVVLNGAWLIPGVQNYIIIIFNLAHFLKFLRTACTCINYLKLCPEDHAITPTVIRSNFAAGERIRRRVRRYINGRPSSALEHFVILLLSNALLV